MGRRRKTEETNPEVNNNTNIPEENVSEVNSESTESNIEPAEIPVIEEPTIQKGSRVKIKPGIANDIMGRRIHNGIKNYVYTVLAVRTDGYCTIECLTYVFTLPSKDLDLVK